MSKKKSTLDPKLLGDVQQVISDLEISGMDASVNIVRDLLAEAERRYGLYWKLHEEVRDLRVENRDLKERVKELEGQGNG